MRPLDVSFPHCIFARLLSSSDHQRHRWTSVRIAHRRTFFNEHWKNCPLRWRQFDHWREHWSRHESPYALFQFHIHAMFQNPRFNNWMKFATQSRCCCINLQLFFEFGLLCGMMLINRPVIDTQKNSVHSQNYIWNRWTSNGRDALCTDACWRQICQP